MTKADIAGVRGPDRLLGHRRPAWLVRLVGRQQPHDQPDQLAGGEHKSPFVLMVANFVILFVIVSGITWLVQANGVGGLTEVITEIAITGASEGCILSLKVSGLSLSPLKACKFGDLSLVEIKASDIANFGDEASGKDRPDAWDRLEGVGAKVQLLLDSGFDPFLLVLQKGDLFEAQSQDLINRLLKLSR